MITTTTNYIVYTAGHRRHHGGTQTQLIPQANGVATAGDNLPITAFDSLPYNGSNLPFAFMAVSGAADGSHLYTSPGTQNIPVGDNNIKILIVYAPAGGPGGDGGPGVWVDPFNVDICDFSDSDFMQVFTGSTLDAAKTATANNDGVVSSTTAEDLRAFTSVDGVPFLEWKKIGGVSDTDADYNLAASETGFVFAFYQSPASVPPPHVPTEKGETWVYVSPGVLIDAGGFVIGPDGKPHPVDPLGILQARLLSTVALMSISTNMDADIRKQAIGLAQNHLSNVARSLDQINL